MSSTVDDVFYRGKISIFSSTRFQGCQKGRWGLVASDVLISSDLNVERFGILILVARKINDFRAQQVNSRPQTEVENGLTQIECF